MAHLLLEPTLHLILMLLCCGCCVLSRNPRFLFLRSPCSGIKIIAPAHPEAFSMRLNRSWRRLVVHNDTLVLSCPLVYVHDVQAGYRHSLIHTAGRSAMLALICSLVHTSRVELWWCWGCWSSFTDRCQPRMYSGKLQPFTNSWLILAVHPPAITTLHF